MFAQNNFGDTMSDGLAGPMGLLIIVLLAIATVLLIRNMNKHLRRIPERFPDQGTPSGRTETRAELRRETRAETPTAGGGAPSDETQ